MVYMAGDKPAKKRPAAGAAEGAPKKQRVAKGAAPAGGKPPAKHAPASFSKGPKPAAAPPPQNKKERRELNRARKVARSRTFGTVQECVGMWEELRRHELDPEKRTRLVTQVLGKVESKVAELAGSHTGSRMIQACVKFGTPEDREKILKELEPKLLELSKSPYGHHVVSKLVSMAPKEQLPGLLKAFRGHLGELLRHPAGAHIVDDLWGAASGAQRNAMAAEFYGREYALFEGGLLNGGEGPPARLADLMCRVDPAKQRAVIQLMARDLLPILEKGLLDAQLLHRLVAEFLEFAPASVAANAVESLCGDPLLHIVHTHEGARAACMALAWGTPKDRKKAVKAMKGHVPALARDEWGHLVLITALSVVDDTTLLRKNIVAELQKELPELAAHRSGHRVLLQLLHPYCGRYLPPALAAVARPPVKECSPEAAAAAASAAAHQQQQAQAEAAAAGEEADGGSSDEEGEGASGKLSSGPLGASKKDPTARRRELLGSGPGSLAAALCTLCAEHAGELLRSQNAGDVVVEVCRGGEGGLLEECAGGEALAAVHAAVAAAAEGTEAAAAASDGDDDNEEEEAAEGGKEAAKKEEDHEPLLTHYFASRALRRLALAAAEAGPTGAAAGRCVDALWDGALAGSCPRWVETHAAKVLGAVLQGGSKRVRAAAAAELKPLLGGEAPEAWAAQFVQGKPQGKQQQQLKKQQRQQKRKAAAAAQPAKRQPKQQPKGQAQKKRQK